MNSLLKSSSETSPKVLAAGTDIKPQDWRPHGELSQEQAQTFPFLGVNFPKL